MHIEQPSPLSLLTVVLFGFVWPLLTSQQAGCTQKLKKLQLFDHLEQGPIFHSQRLTAQKRGKTKFPWRCNAVYYQQLEKKKILGNLRKSQLALLFWRFDGLHHNIVLLAFSSWTWQHSAYRLRTLMHISPFTVCHCLLEFAAVLLQKILHGGG